MKTIMIIGANRGIGLESVKQYLAEGYRVLATCRQPAQAENLQALALQHQALSIMPCNINEEASVKALAQQLDQPIDILLINAGISSDNKTLENATVDDLINLFRTNAVGHFLVAKYFYPLVAKSEDKQIVSISSRMGSMADNTSGTRYAYRASKAAVNAIMRSFAHDLAEHGIHVTIYHPGWVKTDMTKFSGNLEVSEAVKRLRHTIANAKQHESGLFHSHDGTLLPW